MTDTAGQEDFDQLRTLGYYNAGVVVVDFNKEIASRQAGWTGSMSTGCWSASEAGTTSMSLMGSSGRDASSQLSQAHIPARVALRLPYPTLNMPNGDRLNGQWHPVVGKIVRFCKKLNCCDKSHSSHYFGERIWLSHAIL